MFGLLQRFHGASRTSRRMARPESSKGVLVNPCSAAPVEDSGRATRCIGISLIVATIAGAVLLPFFARGQDGGAQGSIFSADNESGRSRTINVAGFPVVASDNPFFLDLG